MSSKPKPLKVYGRSHYACTRCKISKIKCSGEKPCTNCKNVNKPDGCVYPSRNRKIVIMESDLDALNERIRHLESNLAKTTQPSAVKSTFANTTVQERLNEDTREFLFNNTGLENFLLADSANEMLGWKMDLCKNALPSKETALQLIDTVYTHYASEFYLIDLNAFLSKVNLIYALGDVDVINMEKGVSRQALCFFFIVLAFGEQLSNSNHHEDKYPGIDYYLKASELFNVTHEEVTLDFIQAAGLLALYSANLNRYNTVYHYFGVAIRAAISQGLHRQKAFIATDPDQAISHEKSKRLWWTIFIIDATWTAKMNMPAQIDYTETDVDLPGDNAIDLHDNFDTGMLDLNVHLAKYISKSVKSIYGANMRTISVNYINTEQFNRRQLIRNSAECFNELIDNFEIPFLYQFKGVNLLEHSGRKLANLFLRFNLLVVHITKPLMSLIFKKLDFGVIENTKEVEQITNKSIAVSVSTINILQHLFELNRVFIIGFYDSQYLFSSILSLIMTSVTDRKCYDIIHRALAMLKFMANHNNINAQNCIQKLRQVNDYLVKIPEIDFTLDFDVIITNYISPKSFNESMFYNPYNEVAPHPAPLISSFRFRDNKPNIHDQSNASETVVNNFQQPPDPMPHASLRSQLPGANQQEDHQMNQPPINRHEMSPVDIVAPQQINIQEHVLVPQHHMSQGAPQMVPGSQYPPMNNQFNLNEGQQSPNRDHLTNNRIYNLNDTTQNALNSMVNSIQSWDDYRNFPM